MERVVKLGHCRLDDWHESVRRAAVVAVAKIAAGRSQKTNRAEQRQRQQRHAMACWKGWVLGSLFVLDSFVATFWILEWSWILNSCDYLCVCVVQCCSPVNFVNFMMTQEKGDQHSIELEKTACDDRRISLFFRFPRRMRSFHSGSAAVATCWAMDGLTCAGRGLCGRCGLGARWQKVLFLHMIYSIQT